MKLIVKGQIFPRVWDAALSVLKLRDERKLVNIGAGSVGFPVYEVTLPDGTRKEGLFYVTPDGERLYFYPGDQYQIAYLVSERDTDPIALKHFGQRARQSSS